MPEVRKVEIWVQMKRVLLGICIAAAAAAFVITLSWLFSERYSEKEYWEFPLGFPRERVFPVIVEYENGAPAEMAQVWLAENEPENLAQTWRAIAYEETDNLGRARILTPAYNKTAFVAVAQDNLFGKGEIESMGSYARVYSEDEYGRVTGILFAKWKIPWENAGTITLSENRIPWGDDC